MKERREVSFEEVEAVISRIRPAVENEGGRIDLIEVAGSDARVSLRGSFTACSGSVLLLKFGIHRALREAIPSFGELTAEVFDGAGRPVERD